MTKKEIAIVMSLGFAAIAQISFFPHLNLVGGIWSDYINLVSLAVFFISIFEKRRHNLGWITAFWGGIFLGMYSDKFFGFWIMILFLMVAAVKFLLKKYVSIPSFW